MRRISTAALISLFAAVPPLVAEPRIAPTTIRLQTSAGAIPTEIYEARGAARRPAILVLHGAGGTLFDGAAMRRVAQALAADGNAVYLPHYFRATGNVVALDSTMQRHFGDWLEVVQSSVTSIQEVRNDSSPVGIFGYSLGGFLAMRAASNNPRVGAVVELAGGAWNQRTDHLGRMPAVLMLHGERDGRVPFSTYAEPLVPVLRRRAAALETRFFPEEGHRFSTAATAAVHTDAARFFRRHLRAKQNRDPLRSGSEKDGAGIR
jgi:carboxymethylenebutenolidase